MMKNKPKSKKIIIAIAVMSLFLSISVTVHAFLSTQMLDALWCGAHCEKEYEDKIDGGWKDIIMRACFNGCMAGKGY